LASKGTKLSPETRAKISASNTGKKHSAETRAKISASKTGKIPWNKGKKHSPESIAKMSESHKGQIPWNKGKKGIFSPETRAKISAWQIGRKLSPETRAKMSKSSPRFWQDKKRSPETIAKISASLTGKIPWNKGKKGKKRSPETIAKMSKSSPRFWQDKKRSPETIAKISAGNTGKIPWNKGKKGIFSPETRAKISAGNTGKKLSPETRAKISANTPRFWQGKKLSPETRAKLKASHNKPETIAKMSAYRLTQVFPIEDTKIEIKLQELLKTNNIPFLKHKAILGQPDIFIEPNTCIFADGDYWHGWFYLQGMDFSNQRKFNNEYFATKIKRDQSITTRLEAKGYKVLRLWEHEIIKEPKKCLNRIRALL